MVHFTAINGLGIAVPILIFSGLFYLYYRPSVTHAVQMKCSQNSTDVLCEFHFTNNGKEDIYLMKRNTPLEGLRSDFLTIKHGQHHVKYEGRCFKRVPITKDEYTLLPAGHTISTPSIIAVNRAYKFSHDGSYTIQYTGPLVYHTRDRMDALLQEDDQQLTEGSHSQSNEEVLASTQVNLKDVHNFHKLDKEIEVGETAKITDNVQAHVTAPRALCPEPTYNSVSEERREKITPVHQTMCEGLANSIKEAKSDNAKYKEWFGTANTDTVRGSLKEMFNGLSAGGKEYSNGYYGTHHCNYYKSDVYAYTYQGTNKVYICPEFDTLPESSFKSGANTVLQTLAHEWSHALAYTYDVQDTYGATNCRNLAKYYPAQAANNADNYGYYYQDTWLSN